MRKRILAILMITALFFVMGPVEMFAETGANDEQPAVENVEGTDEAVVEAEEVPSEEAPSGEAAGEENQTAPAEEGTVPSDATPTDTVPADTAENAAAEEGTTGEEPAAVPSVTEVAITAGEAKADSVELSWTYKEGEALGEGETLTIYNGETLVTEITGATVSYEVTGLEPNTDYTFTFKVGDKTVGSVDVKTAPAEVPNFRSVSSYKTIVLRWDAVENASEYIIEWSGENDSDTVTTSRLEWTHKKVNGKKLSAYDVINLYNTKAGSKVSGDLKGKDRFTYKITAVDADGNVLASSETTGDIVKTLYYKITFKSGATLTSHSGGAKQATFKKGQVIYARGFTDGKYVFDYKCRDGKIRTYYTMKIRVTAKLSKHITAKKKKRGTSTLVYTDEEAIQYINDRGVSSRNKYMIWANLFTQKEYIFKGKKGKWKIAVVSGNGLDHEKLSQLPISSGRATMPTATGATKINEKLKSQHGTPLWNVTKYFSVHGCQKKWPKTGWPESGACVRNRNTYAPWIYYNVPKYSRVFVH